MDVTEITWNYTPADYFEAPIQAAYADAVLTFDAGTAIYTTRGAVRVRGRELLDAGMERLRAVLDVRRLLTNRTYVVTHTGFHTLRDDGSRDTTLFVESAHHMVFGDSIDLVAMDKDGNILRDSKSERIASQAVYVTELAARCADSPTLRAMVRSYGMSIDDPHNSLVHLYEVCDAAARHFGSQTDARNALGITKKEWSRLGQLSNIEPLAEGRHRGAHVSQLRAATSDEIREAQVLAKRILDAFAACC